MALAVGALSAASQKWRTLRLRPSADPHRSGRPHAVRSGRRGHISFLRRWQHSRLDLLKSGYQALHDLVLGAWYADPQSWAAIGYRSSVLVKS